MEIVTTVQGLLCRLVAFALNFERHLTPLPRHFFYARRTTRKFVHDTRRAHSFSRTTRGGAYLAVKLGTAKFARNVSKATLPEKIPHTTDKWKNDCSLQESQNGFSPTRTFQWDFLVGAIRKASSL